MVQHAQSSLYDRTTADYEAPRESRDLMMMDAQPTPVPQVQWSAEDKQALKDAACKDLTDAEFRVFLIAAQRYGLDPFAKQIYGWKQGGKLITQASIDGLRTIAERTRKYRGQLGPFWCGADGEWKDQWLLKEAPVACKVGVLRSDFDEPMWGFARFASYDKGNDAWRKMHDVMIAKVAESVALRKAFPQQLSGLYIPGEFGDDDFVEADPTPVQVAEQASAPRTQQPPTAKAKATPAAKATTAATMSVKEFCERVKVELGMTPKQAMDELDVKSLAGLNLAQAFDQLDKNLHLRIAADRATLEVFDDELPVTFTIEEVQTLTPEQESHLRLRAQNSGIRTVADFDAFAHAHNNNYDAILRALIEREETMEDGHDLGKAPTSTAAGRH